MLCRQPVVGLIRGYCSFWIQLNSSRSCRSVHKLRFFLLPYGERSSILRCKPDWHSQSLIWLVMETASIFTFLCLPASLPPVSYCSVCVTHLIRCFLTRLGRGSPQRASSSSSDFANIISSMCCLSGNISVNSLMLACTTTTTTTLHYYHALPCCIYLPTGHPT